MLNSFFKSNVNICVAKILRHSVLEFALADLVLGPELTLEEPSIPYLKVTETSPLPLSSKSFKNPMNTVLHSIFQQKGLLVKFTARIHKRQNK